MSDVLGPAVRQLNPIVEQIIGDPEDHLIDTCTTELEMGILRLLLSLRQLSNCDPVVVLRSEDFASEAK